MTPIAYFHSAFPTKFGIPRQSGIIDTLRGRIIFTPEYRNMDALRGLDGFDYLWIIWEFSANRTREEHSATSLSQGFSLIISHNLRKIYCFFKDRIRKNG